ncbi:hypothetical protein MRY87_09050 [bacterium]|nr:hypothetical protein [bacterium]
MRKGNTAVDSSCEELDPRPLSGEAALHTELSHEEGARNSLLTKALLSLGLTQEIGDTRWSLWVATFSATNVLLFSLFRRFLLPGEGDATVSLDQPELFIYSLVLSLLTSAGFLLLVSEYLRKPPRRVLRYGGELIALAALGVITLTSLFLSVFGVELLPTPFFGDIKGEGVAEIATWMFFGIAWWIPLRSRFAELFQRDAESFLRQKAPEESAAILAPTGEQDGGEVFHLTEGKLAPAPLTVIRGVALVKNRGGGPDETPLLRQAGDLLQRGSLIVRGKVDAAPCSSNTFDDFFVRTGWADEQRKALLQSESEANRQLARTVSTVSVAAIAITLVLAGLARGAVLPLYPFGYLDLTATLLIALLPIELLLFVRFFRSGVIERFFQFGVVFQDFALFERLQRMNKIVFRIGTQTPFVGAARTTGFQLVDERVDRDSFFGVVFALLRNADNPAHVSIREYCYENCPKADLYPVTAEDSDGQSYVSGCVQGAPFLVGTEEALIARGVHLEVSEAYHAQRARFLRYYVALGQEVVGSFTVEPPFYGEMPRLVSAIRRYHLRPILEGIGIDREELDYLGKELGFELADIREASGVERGAVKRGAGEEDTFTVLLSPEEEHSLAPQEGRGLALTWFRESLWNVSFPGVLLLRRDLFPVLRLYVFARRLHFAQRAATVFVVASVFGIGGGSLLLGLSPLLALVIALAVLFGGMSVFCGLLFRFSLTHDR